MLWIARARVIATRSGVMLWAVRARVIVLESLVGRTAGVGGRFGWWLRLWSTMLFWMLWSGSGGMKGRASHCRPWMRPGGSIRGRSLS
ncbi:hypothetical protein J3R03_009653 [Actinoplanes couchii]|nr:hypothetical protein [Actinoplanes couchii]